MADVDVNADEVCADIDNFMSRYAQNVIEAADEMAAQIRDLAEQSYAQAEYTGMNDIQVQNNVSNGNGSVNAVSPIVGFVEYGTGINNPEHPLSNEYPHGSYGFHMGARENGWGYVGEQGNSTQTQPYRHKDGTIVEGKWWTTGVPASMSMYLAYKEAYAQFNEKVKGLVGK